MNRRSFLGVLVAGAAGLAIAPRLAISDAALASAPRVATARVRIHYVGGFVYEFAGLPVVLDGDTWRVPDVTVTASGKVERVSSVWEIPGLEIQGHDLCFGHTLTELDPDLTLRPGDTLTITGVALRMV